MLLMEKIQRNIKIFYKKIYPYSNKFIIFTQSQVLEAWKTTSLNYIPGKSLSTIKNKEEIEVICE